MKRLGHLDVSWYMPKRKRPFAYSTVAARDCILTLAEEYTTIQDVYDHIHFDLEAKAILKAYIDKGYGDEIAAEWFK